MRPPCGPYRCGGSRPAGHSRTFLFDVIRGTMTTGRRRDLSAPNALITSPLSERSESDAPMPTGPRASRPTSSHCSASVTATPWSSPSTSGHSTMSARMRTPSWTGFGTAPCHATAGGPGRRSTCSSAGLRAASSADRSADTRCRAPVAGRERPDVGDELRRLAHREVDAEQAEMDGQRPRGCRRRRRGCTSRRRPRSASRSTVRSCRPATRRARGR